MLLLTSPQYGPCAAPRGGGRVYSLAVTKVMVIIDNRDIITRQCNEHKYINAFSVYPMSSCIVMYRSLPTQQGAPSTQFDWSPIYLASFVALFARKAVKKAKKTYQWQG